MRLLFKLRWFLLDLMLNQAERRYFHRMVHEYVGLVALDRRVAEGWAGDAANAAAHTNKMLLNDAKGFISNFLRIDA